MRGRGYGRGLPTTRHDNFRSRPPNTSRPPSMHVDDYMKMELEAAVTVGPTGMNPELTKYRQRLWEEKNASPGGPPGGAGGAGGGAGGGPGAGGYVSSLKPTPEDLILFVVHCSLFSVLSVFLKQKLIFSCCSGLSWRWSGRWS